MTRRAAQKKATLHLLSHQEMMPDFEIVQPYVHHYRASGTGQITKHVSIMDKLSTQYNSETDQDAGTVFNKWP